MTAPSSAMRCGCGDLFANARLLGVHAAHCPGQRPAALVELVFDFPLPPNLASTAESRGSWQAKYGKQQAYFDACDRLVQAGRLPRAPFRAPAQARMVAILRTSLAMDPENARLRAEKWPVDWLKTRGYIADDDLAHLERGPLVQERCARVRAGVQITLTPRRGAAG